MFIAGHANPLKYGKSDTFPDVVKFFYDNGIRHVHLRIQKENMEMFQKDIGRLLELKSLGMSYIIHAPSEGFDNFEDAEESVKKSIVLAQKVGAEKVVVHPIYKLNGNYLKDEINRYAECYKNVAAFARGRVKLYAENLCEMVDSPETLSSFSERICLDVGHAAAANALDQFLSTDYEIGAVHLHDYDGKNTHLRIGGGIIDFKNVVNSLKRMKYSGPLVLEMSPQDVILSKNELEKLI